MACEVPVVCTDLPQLIDIVDGCGLMVPVRDPEALADRIDALLSDESLAQGTGPEGAGAGPESLFLGRYRQKDAKALPGIDQGEELIRRNFIAGEPFAMKVNVITPVNRGGP